jgi:hypothetical protein
MNLKDSDVDVYPHTKADTRLVNIKYLDDYTVIDTYIGKAENCPSELNPTKLRNPYSIAEHGRDGAVEIFAAYFYHRYITDEEFRKTVHSRQGDTLGGWSYPSKCHGEIIVDLLRQIEKSDNGEEVLGYINEELVKLDVHLLNIEGLKFREEAMNRIEEIV